MRMFKQCIIFSLLILSICYDESVAADSPCGDWEPYKDEKCFIIIDKTLRTYDDAEKACNQQENSATLVIIRSKEEQDSLSNFLFKTKKIIENVWIGVKYTSNNFKWIDDSDLSFTNWAIGSPQNGTAYDCVQMIPDTSSMGKWINEPCGRRNLVVCQKMQNWPISLLQKTLLEQRKLLYDAIKEINNLRQNTPPIGFIYIQLPSQSEPKTLWSTGEWKDVTSDYAGLFFRAEGGGSAAFEQMQSENSPRLINVKYYGCSRELKLSTSQVNILADGSLSPAVVTAYFNSESKLDAQCAINFSVSSGEVRPRNKAMRIWKRTK